MKLSPLVLTAALLVPSAASAQQVQGCFGGDTPLGGCFSAELGQDHDRLGLVFNNGQRFFGRISCSQAGVKLHKGWYSEGIPQSHAFRIAQEHCAQRHLMEGTTASTIEA